MAMKSKRRKVGLLDSYTGGNFGDGAIQDAVIHHLNRRVPDSIIELISLNPVRTTEIHQVASLPLTTRVFLGGRGKPPRRLWRPAWRIVQKPFRLVDFFTDEVRHLHAIRFWLREYRLLIVSGGGQLDDYWGGPMGHPYNLLKWTTLARLMGVPVVFLSVGVDQLAHRVSRRFIRIALKFAVYRSYRDTGSKPLLADMPFTRSDAVTPDLAFSFDPAQPMKDRKAGGPHLRVGISPMAYMLKNYWPRENENIFRPYFDALTSFTSDLLAQGHEVMLFATAAADHHVVDLLLARLQSLPPDQQGRLRRVAAGCLRELLPDLSQLDLVVASRLHGVIVPQVLAIPVLAISYDRKVTQQMQDMNQERYCRDIHTVKLDELKETFVRLSSELPAAQALLKQRVAVFRGLLDEQYKRIATLING